jgi:hypothetical protein
MFAPLWDGTARKELLLQRCSACGAFRHPPSPICRSCLSDQHEWVAASGRGTVYTYAVVRQALGRGWEEKVPYVVAVIELDEGPRFLTNVVNVDPDAVQIGMPVEVVYLERADAATLPLFQPRSA